VHSGDCPSALLNLPAPACTYLHRRKCLPLARRLECLPGPCLQGDYDSALFHFQQLLERNPRHYPALAQLVQLLRWAGRPQDAKQYLEAALGNTTAAAGGSGSSSSSGGSSSGGAAPAASTSSPAGGSAASEPGYHYCMGLWCK
jgi:hypothetical protein